MMKIVTIGEIVVEIMATERNQQLSQTGLFLGRFQVALLRYLLTKLLS